MKKEEQLPKGVRKNKGSYEARAKINGVSICLHGKDLEALLNEFNAAKAAASSDVTTQFSNITLSKWFDYWFNNVKSKRLKITSQQPMRRRFETTFGNYIGGKKLVDVKPIDVQGAVNALETLGRSMGVIREAFGIFRDCMEFALANQLITSNPCIAVEVPWPDKITEEEIPLTQEEQNLFLNFLESENNWYTEMFYILFLTGLRVGELGGLQWQDIDFKKKCFTVKRSLSCFYHDGIKEEGLVSPKTVNSYRTIPFLGEAEEMLLTFRKKSEVRRKELTTRWRTPEEYGDLVFVTTMGSPCTRYIVQKEIQKVVKRIRDKRAMEAVTQNVAPERFPSFHPHTCRHTFATRCFEYGMDPKVVQKLMGHVTISTTLNIYTHVLKGKSDEELRKFNRANTVHCIEENFTLPKITAKGHR